MMEMRVEKRTLRRQSGAHLPRSPYRDFVRVKTERKGIGRLKVVFILLIALLQLCLLAFLHLTLTSAFRSYLIFSVVLDIITCFYILGSSKNGRSKPVWVMLVLVLFPVGFLVYFLSDERIFFRSSRKRYAAILQASAGMLTGCGLSGLGKSMLRAANYMVNTTGFVPYKNTRAKYYPSGASAFDDMLIDCAGARKFIFIEYFIIAEGALYSRLFSVLEERAAAGVDVRVIYDDMGSGGRLSRKELKRARNAGIRMYAFNKLVPLYKIGMNYRDHRKITVVDGELAYTGGINISDEYVNEKRLYGYWKDNAVRVEGDAVQSFTLMFLRQWEFVTKKPFDYAPFLYADGAKFPAPLSGSEKAQEKAEAQGENPCVAEVQEVEPRGTGAVTIVSEAERAATGNIVAPPKEEAADIAPAAGEGQGVFIPYAAGLEFSDPVVRDVYAGAISQAYERVWIMTPYFVPDETITNLLASKARSGADVRIVLPGVPDKAYVYLVSLDNADKLTKSGVKVYTMADSFVHTKSVLTENCAIIGSANFDLRSFFQQYENALYTDDKTVMRGLERDFEDTFPECVQRGLIDGKAGPLRTLLTAILQIFAPMM